MNNKGNLGSADDFGDVGEVDMFGLDEFGQPVGGDSLWGGIIGAGVSTSASILVRALSTPTSTAFEYSEAAGLAAGVAAGGLLMAFPSTRRMGLAAIATSAVTNGLRQLEQSLFPAKFSTAEANALAAKAAASSTGTAPPSAVNNPSLPSATPNQFGGVVMDPTGVIRPYQGLGIHTIEPGYAVHGNGFGAVAIDPAYPVPGSIHGASNGFAGNMNGPPTLVGAGDYGMGDNPGAAQTKLLGGPSVSALGAHFGATLFGGPN